MKTYLRGHSILLTRRLLQADGSELAVADVLAVTCEVIQGATVKATLVLGSDNRLRADGSSLLLELTGETTAAMSAAPVKERYTLTLTDAEYVAQGGQRTVKLEITQIALS